MKRIFLSSKVVVVRASILITFFLCTSIIFSSFRYKPEKPKLIFKPVAMTSDLAWKYADDTSSLVEFIFQHKNLDQDEGKSRHEYNLITFTKTSPTDQINGPFENILIVTTLEEEEKMKGDVRFSNYKMTKDVLRSVTPPRTVGAFAQLIFKPLECSDAKFNKYICYKVYAADRRGNEIPGAVKYLTSMQPSPPLAHKSLRNSNLSLP